MYIVHSKVCIVYSIRQSQSATPILLRVRVRVGPYHSRTTLLLNKSRVKRFTESVGILTFINEYHMHFIWYLTSVYAYLSALKWGGHVVRCVKLNCVGCLTSPLQGLCQDLHLMGLRLGWTLGWPTYDWLSLTLSPCDQRWVAAAAVVLLSSRTHHTYY